MTPSSPSVWTSYVHAPKMINCGDDDVGECAEICDAALPGCGHPCGLRCHGPSQGVHGKQGCANHGIFVNQFINPVHGKYLHDFD